jgi:hypothetical protein
MRPVTASSLAVTVALSASVAAGAQTTEPAHYGGALVRDHRTGAITIGLTRGGHGKVSARFGFTVRCRGVLWENRVIHATGRASGSTFRVSGHVRAGRSRVTMTATGRIAGNAVTGELTARGRRCTTLDRAPFSLRAAALPGGPPGIPARGTVLLGLTSQSAGGVRLPVALYVAANGRLAGNWEALARCGRRRLPVMNLEPFLSIHAGGTFASNEAFAIRFHDGTRATYRVAFAGRFTGGGATGTLSARVRRSDPKHHRRLAPCATGTQTWTAAP